MGRWADERRARAAGFARIDAYVVGTGRYVSADEAQIRDVCIEIGEICLARRRSGLNHVGRRDAGCRRSPAKGDVLS